MLKTFRQSRFIGLLLISSMLFLSTQSTVNAAIVSTTDLVAQQQTQFDRNYLLKSLDREEVQAVLVSKGVDIQAAKLRVSGMTNEEVRLLNARFDQLPAGSSIHGTIGLVLIILLITDLFGVTDVYSFIN